MRKKKRHGETVMQSTVRKKMAAQYFTTIPCEPNPSQKAQRKTFFSLGKIRPYSKKIVYARFEIFRTFLCVFKSVFRVFER